MAVVNYEILVDKVRLKVIKWEGLGNGDTGQWYAAAGHYPDKSCHAMGTPGTGLSLKMEGTNEVGTPASSVDLHDATEDVINIQTLPSMVLILESTGQIRPNVEAGDGTTDVDVLLMMKG